MCEKTLLLKALQFYSCGHLKLKLYSQKIEETFEKRHIDQTFESFLITNLGLSGKLRKVVIK